MTRAARSAAFNSFTGSFAMLTIRFFGRCPGIASVSSKGRLGRRPRFSARAPPRAAYTLSRPLRVGATAVSRECAKPSKRALVARNCSFIRLYDLERFAKTPVVVSFCNNGSMVPK